MTLTIPGPLYQWHQAGFVCTYYTLERISKVDLMFLLRFTNVECTKLTWVTENLKRKRKDTLIYAWKTDPKMMTRVFTMKSHTHVSHWLTQPHVVSSGSDRSRVSSLLSISRFVLLVRLRIHQGKQLLPLISHLHHSRIGGESLKLDD